MNKSKGFSAILTAGTTVFAASICIMMLELVAGRLIARSLGSSLYTWTAVIGVVLAGVTVGNYLGGRIADRWEARKALSVIFAICSAACVLTIVLNNTVGQWEFLWRLGWPVRVFSHVCIVFLIPSALLGTISPVVAKMALDNGLPTGRTVGDIYAAGAAGSIAGTFLAGFYLIAAMGTIAIIWTVGGVLMLLAILYAARLWQIYALTIVYICALFLAVLPTNWCRTVGAAMRLREVHNPLVLYEDETQYCYVKVEMVPGKDDKRAFVQDRLLHSSIVMSHPYALQYPYEQIMATVTDRFCKDNSKLAFLIIGGGGYVLPRYLEKFRPGSTVDVAEIDPGVTKAAIKAFGLPPSTTINTISLDARNYVDELLERGPAKKYDFIYEDALNDYAVPYQLTTREFNEKLARLLTDDGIYMVELIDSFDKAKFLGAFVNTLGQTFNFVSVISTRGVSYHDRNTFVVIAAKHKLDLTNVCEGGSFTQTVWYLDDAETAGVRAKANGMILTDDYAPVENLLATVAGENTQEILANQYMRNAEEFLSKNEPAKAIEEYEKVLKTKTALSIKAYNSIALIQADMGDLNAAVESFKKELEANEKTGVKQDLSAVHLNLGIMFFRMKKTEESRAHLQEAIKGFREMLRQNPKAAWVWADLGKAHLEMDEFDEAYKAFTEAIKLEPDNPIHYKSLAVSLELQKRYDEANRELNVGYRFMLEHHLANEAAELRKFLENAESRRARLRQ